jgi:hypothetical protein
MLYGQWLNRCTRVKPVLLTHKPLSNIVEAHITQATGGSKELFIGEALFGSRFQRLSFLPIHQIGMGPQKGTGMEFALHSFSHEKGYSAPLIEHVGIDGFQLQSPIYRVYILQATVYL